MTENKKPRYHLGSDGEFIIENYNSTKPFSSFFPGIAGAHGIPMWVFYVNRGQCISSMGISDKDHPIMEFLSANRAYQLVSTQGFRTFVKIMDGKKPLFYEPFQVQMISSRIERTQRMIIYPAQLTLEEENKTLGLKFSVDFFNVPEDKYAGLIRILRIQNLRKKPVKLEVLDGLPLIIPFGVDNYNLTHMRRLVESFVEVINFEKKVPYFKGRVKQEDRPEVIRIKEGNFYVGFVDGKQKTNIVPPIVDPVAIFGSLTDFSYPARFLEKPSFKPGAQMLENRLPSAMGLFTASIPAGRTHTYYSIVGNINSVDEVNRLTPSITSRIYVEKKQAENRDLIDRLTQNNLSYSNSKKFDLYCRQNFLDNVLRGGLPTSFKSRKGKTTAFHIYSRAHGDPERDYNYYRLSPTNYSQGNGNYRDVNQNRRNDLFFNPDIKEDNVVHFYNLIQLDGFNPLAIKNTMFAVKDGKALAALLASAFSAKDVEPVKAFLAKRFTPGYLCAMLAEKKIALKMDQDEFLGELLALCEKHQDTDFGHGFWSDHWTYNIDLLENYLALYPENLRPILLENRSFTFFDNAHRVLPRSDKYVLWDGHAMQLGAVVMDHEKERLIKQRTASPLEVRAMFGKGDIYYTNLATKLLCLVVNKLASLDPEGVGVEMESDKPNWYDALNGLPGQLGSSLSETLELKRLILFILESITKLNIDSAELWAVPVEIREFMVRLQGLLKNYFTDKRKERDFLFWDQATASKEAYREQTRLGVSGYEERIAVGDLKDFFSLALEKIEIGIRKAWGKSGKIPATYFINKVVEYELITETDSTGNKQFKKNGNGQSCFRALRFKQIPLPLFLEGPVHFLRIERDQAEARALAREIKRSGLYDRKLRMYKVNESLSDQPMEIGRTRIFTPGWLENESIWMHMEYKYMLELLRSGLYTEFYEDFKHVLVPFLDPEMYGRSIFENSSFICSSANPDKSLHGNGFVARLSGSTAEFIHLFLMMAAGQKPFRINSEGELQLQLKPTLPSWLFTEKKEVLPFWKGHRQQMLEFPPNTFSFTFLGNILITYHNPDRLDTFGPSGVSPRSMTITDLDGKVTRVSNGLISGPLARQIRDRQVARIWIELG